eukprot:TRINITY_DN3241_c0_g1_i5.p1 TRINITY_DN3241_c0_g1~~TRINITY_DN3241_c0_g1_i5.p1  ORF type:complete len:184 (-),score=22.50 TRINITY_DN3241_c0_g1_i5:485-1036(-)
MQLGFRPEVLPSRRENCSLLGRSVECKQQYLRLPRVCRFRTTVKAQVVETQTQSQEQVSIPEATSVRATEEYKFNTDKYAIIEVGGVQQLVEEGRWYTCNRLQAEPGSRISFGRVLAIKKDGDFHVGQPYLTAATVQAEILEEFKGPKVLVFKYKPKKHYKRKVGHRQPLSKYMVTKIDIIEE